MRVERGFSQGQSTGIPSYLSQANTTARSNYGGLQPASGSKSGPISTSTDAVAGADTLREKEGTPHIALLMLQVRHPARHSFGHAQNRPRTSTRTAWVGDFPLNRIEKNRSYQWVRP